jgi:hypothetical protein
MTTVRRDRIPFRVQRTIKDLVASRIIFQVTHAAFPAPPLTSAPSTEIWSCYGVITAGAVGAR